VQTPAAAHETVVAELIGGHAGRTGSHIKWAAIHTPRITESGGADGDNTIHHNTKETRK
jgi:hypothetical protein